MRAKDITNMFIGTFEPSAMREVTAAEDLVMGQCGGLSRGGLRWRNRQRNLYHEVNRITARRATPQRSPVGRKRCFLQTMTSVQVLRIFRLHILRGYRHQQHHVLHLTRDLT